MQSFKIYGTKYTLNPTSKVPADTYAIKGQLADDQPKGKLVGYVTMEDGSVVECYKKKKLFLILIPIILLIVGLAGGAVYLFLIQPKDVVILGDIIKIGSDNNIVTYNGFPSVRDGQLSIQFTNGDYPATIQIEGDGVKSKTIQVMPAEFVDFVPCEFTTEEGVVEATITIKTETSTQAFPIIVEIPDNLNANDKLNGLEGYWNGEQIYGPE
ncbi:MAG: hypothetical protein NC489_30220 [Ruminococcus flavefaciens]|nr:hypothetical protein [Ruminococcus flavefaciens]